MPLTTFKLNPIKWYIEHGHPESGKLEKQAKPVQKQALFHVKEPKYDLSLMGGWTCEHRGIYLLIWGGGCLSMIWWNWNNFSGFYFPSREQIFKIKYLLNHYQT